MITPINIALFGVVLAAVALVILRRRHSGGTHEAASAEAPHAMTPADEPAAAVEDDVFSKHVWAETAATLTPVREDEALAVADAEDELEAGDEPRDADPVADGPEDDVEAPVADSGEPDQDTGELHELELELEAMADPDDGLGDIITEPGWYLPGETDMTRGSPGSPSGLLVAEDEDELVLSGGPLDELAPPAADASAHPPDEDALGFGAAPEWTAPAENGAPAAESAWLGLADEEGAAAAVDGETSFEIEPSPSDDLFALPPLEPAITNGASDAEAPSFPLDRWQEPVTPGPAFAPVPAPGDLTVTRHGPLTVSIDPAALLAIETEGVERSSSRADGDVSWELTLRVELRQRANGTGNGNGSGATG